MMELPRRKRNRLKNYDYSSPGVYFITICTRNMAELFWDNVDIPVAEITDVGAASGRPQHCTNLPQSHCLSAYGQIVDVAIQNIRRFYPAVSVNKYVIMPNHVHLLLQIHSDDFGRPLAAPTISTVIQRMKAYVTKQIGFSVWQKLFHDHIVRTPRDYDMIWQYIENNPLKWEEDCFYPK